MSAKSTQRRYYADVLGVGLHHPDVDIALGAWELRRKIKEYAKENKEEIEKERQQVKQDSLGRRDCNHHRPQMKEMCRLLRSGPALPMELAKQMNLYEGVYQVIHALERGGYVIWPPGRTRTRLVSLTEVGRKLFEGDDHG